MNINRCSWIHLDKIIRITWINLVDIAKFMHHIAGFWVRKYRYAESDDASYWTLSCSHSYKGLFNESIAVFKRVYDVHHWVNKESLRMVSPLFYKSKGELVSIEWGYYTFWRSKALFTKEGNSNYHFKKRWRRTLTMVS